MPPAIYVLTTEDIDTIFAYGGSQAWVLDEKRARKSEYVVCVRNGGKRDPDRSAFMVGRLKVPVSLKEPKNRWLLRFSEYALVDMPGAWLKSRNPVVYRDLDVDNLEFLPMPEPAPIVTPEHNIRALTIAEAKDGLSLTFGVSPANIEIIVRG